MTVTVHNFIDNIAKYGIYIYRDFAPILLTPFTINPARVNAVNFNIQYYANVDSFSDFNFHP